MSQNIERSYYNEYWKGSAGWRPTDRIDAELESWICRVVTPGMQAIDVGCGDGTRYGGWLVADRGVRLSGVDVSTVAVEHAKTLGIDAQVIETADALPFVNAQFDLAFCFEVFEHLMNPHLAVAEIFRVLKPGAKLICSVPNCGHWRSRIEHLFLGQLNPGGSPVTSRRAPWRDPHIRFFSRSTLQNMLLEAGFQHVELGALDLQWLNSLPVVRSIIHTKPAKPFAWVTTQIARIWPEMLSGRCLAVATKPRPE